MRLRTIVFALLLFAGCQATTPTTRIEAVSHRPAPFARSVPIGERSLFIDCGGSGSPSVILEAGGGADGTAWHEVLPAVRRFTSACAYDRAGTGRSSAAPRPRTVQHMIDELELLLERAPIEPEYVLTGHSLGGLLARLYTSQHPEDVTGLVLLDPTSEEQALRFWSSLPAEAMAEFQLALRQSPEGLDYDAFVAGMAQLRAAERSLGDRPVIVLTALGNQSAEPGVTAELAEHMAREWLAMHAEVARRSSNSAHLVLDTSHDIARDAPALVAAAVEAVVSSARGKRPLEIEQVLAAARAAGIDVRLAADHGGSSRPTR